jgi:very-short-patch-repair endonuclease
MPDDIDVQLRDTELDANAGRAQMPVYGVTQLRDRLEDGEEFEVQGCPTSRSCASPQRRDQRARRGFSTGPQDALRICDLGGVEERKALQELAEGGVLLASRALASGWPRRSLTRALRAEGWSPLQAGAWAEPGRAPDLLTRLRSVQLLNPRLVVGHGSAAALWQIETLASAAEVPLEFIDPALSFRGKAKGVRVRRLPLGPEDVVQWRGLRFTRAVRTLADLLRSGPRDDALVALESALNYRRVGGVRRHPLTDLGTVTAALAPPLQGAARARGWLQLCDPRSGSPAETVARLRMLDAGLRPESQVEVFTPAGRRFVLDFLFRREGLAVEIEGYAYHGTREAHRRDVHRFNQVSQCPEVRNLLRYTAGDVFHRPAQIVAEIRTAMGTPVR